MNNNARQQGLDRLLRYPELESRFGRCKKSIMRHLAQGKLPRLAYRCPHLSPVNPGIEIENLHANIGQSHALSLAVPAGHQQEEWRREGDSNPR